MANQDFPPPPPGPPPAQQNPPPPTTGLFPVQELAASPTTQTQASTQTTQDQAKPYEFPPPPPGPPPAQHDEKKQPYFPPPPPGPPPSQNPTHPEPLSANPVQSTEQPAQNPTQNYQIPSYNPAAPAFAPPPTSQAQTQTAGSAGTTPVDEHPKKHHGWSERFSQLGLKAAGSVNLVANKLGSNAFLPEELEKECDKASTILIDFCKKGTYADPASDKLPTSTDPKATETTDNIIDPTKEKPKSRVLVTIPPKVISNAVGLAVFTTLRAGFNVTGSVGSGILIARLPDRSWGPPSAISINTLAGGFVVGLDIYDSVLVINTQEALKAFMTSARVSLGSDLAVTAGPYGAGGALEFGAGKAKEEKKPKDEAPKETAPAEQSLKPEVDKKSHRRSLSASRFKPVYSYVKSRGFYAGIQIDGTIIVERRDANTRFYGKAIPIASILKGEVPSATTGTTGWPAGCRGLLDTLREIDAHALKLKEGKESKEGKSPVVAAPAVSTTAPAPPAPAPGSGSSSDPASAPPPAYVDDGVQRPGVGDNKYQYR